MMCNDEYKLFYFHALEKIRYLYKFKRRGNKYRESSRKYVKCSQLTEINFLLLLVTKKTLFCKWCSYWLEF